MNTPDTEWVRELGWKHKDACADGRSCICEIGYITNLLTSRDAYWKERVRKEVDQILRDVLEEHFPVERFLKSRAPAMRYMHIVQARFHDYLQALDNLK